MSHSSKNSKNHRQVEKGQHLMISPEVNCVSKIINKRIGNCREGRTKKNNECYHRVAKFKDEKDIQYTLYFFKSTKSFEDQSKSSEQKEATKIPEYCNKYEGLYLKLNQKINVQLINLNLVVAKSSSHGSLSDDLLNLVFEMKISSFNPTGYFSDRLDFEHKLNKIEKCSDDYGSFQIISATIAYSLSKEPENFWQKLYNDKKLFDFLIISNGIFFRVHKLLLYTKSPVFQDMIDTDMREKRNNCIEFPEYDSEIVEQFIIYLYTNNCDFQVGVDSLFKLAQLYEIKDLQQDCEFYMLNNLERVEDITSALQLVNVKKYKFVYLKNEVYKQLRLKERDLVNYQGFIKYLLDTMTAENIHYVFYLAVKYNYKYLLLNVNNFVKNNIEIVLENKAFRDMLVKHPKIYHKNLVGFYMDIINPENVRLIFQLAMQSNDEQFKKEVMKYIEQKL